MSPADQPQIARQRSTDPSTLWLSLGLGSVLIHLVLFIVMSVTLTRTAKVQLDPEPIAVEFVDPDAAAVQARSTAPSQTIAARPGTPSSTPTDTQGQPSASRSQPSNFNPPVEPFTPLPSARPRRVPLRPQLQQPNPLRNVAPRPSTPSTNPISPQPTSPVQPSNPISPSQDQPLPTNNPSQGTVPGSTAEPSGNTAAITPKLPAEGERITQPPQGQSVAVTVLDASPPPVDVQKQPARPSYREKSILISYPPTLTKQTIRLKSSLVIGSDGSMLGVKETTLLSSGSAIDAETLNGIAEQVFRQWQFEPARDESDGKLVTSPLSNLIVQAEVQLP